MPEVFAGKSQASYRILNAFKVLYADLHTVNRLESYVWHLQGISSYKLLLQLEAGPHPSTLSVTYLADLS